MNDCGCNKKTYNFSMGCCQPVLGPIENYYTKYQIDQMLSGQTSGCCITPEEVDDKISAATSGLQETLIPGDNITISGNVISAEVPSLSGYATEQWVEDKHYLTEHQPLKTINGYTISGTGNIEITASGGSVSVDSELSLESTNPVENKVITEALNDKLDASAYTPVDLSDYVTFDDLPDLTDYATKSWVINLNYATNSELIQYVTNLQNQIDSLKAQISGCCGSSGETITRWITMTGENDFCCSGTTKLTKEAEQQSDDGIHWSDTGNYRTGSTVLEVNSEDCGFIVPFKVKGTNQIVSTTGSVQIDCNSSTVITKDEIKNNFRSASFVTSIQFGSCIDTIGEQALLQAASLSGTVDIPSNITTIEKQAFAGCNASAYTLHEGLVTIGVGAFSYNDIKSINIPNSVTDIRYMAFSYCPSMTGVTIGTGVTHIGHGAFEATQQENVKITSMVINATTPPSLDNGEAGGTFYGSYAIKVPAASVNAYKAAWTQYASRIQAIP